MESTSANLQIPGAQNTPITIGTESPTASNICGRVFNAINAVTNAITYTGISVCCEQDESETELEEVNKEHCARKFKPPFQLSSSSSTVPDHVQDGRRRGGHVDGAEHGREGQRALGDRRIQAGLHTNLVLTGGRTRTKG